MRRLPTVRLAIIMTNSEACWLIEARMAYTTNPTNTIVSSIWNTRQRTERYLEVTERILTRDSGWKLNSKSRGRKKSCGNGELSSEGDTSTVRSLAAEE